MTIPMRFIGRDGSMGLRHGQVYPVRIREQWRGGVLITQPVRCPYDSLASFLRNWSTVEKSTS